MQKLGTLTKSSSSSFKESHLKQSKTPHHLLSGNEQIEIPRPNSYLPHRREVSSTFDVTKKRNVLHADSQSLKKMKITRQMTKSVHFSPKKKTYVSNSYEFLKFLLLKE